MREAKAAAGAEEVMGHGAEPAQSLLREGLLDELEIQLIAVVLGNGRRLFGSDHVELELTRVLDAPRRAPALPSAPVVLMLVALVVGSLRERTVPPRITQAKRKLIMGDSRKTVRIRTL